MGKIICFLFIFVFLLSLASSEVIITKQPDQIYNIGDTISVPLTIKSNAGETLMMSLICNGYQTNFYQGDVPLNAGEEKKIEVPLMLTNKKLGSMKGNCKILGIFGGESVISDNFTISNSIDIYTEIKNVDFNPGDTIIIKGQATKPDKENADGFILMNITSGSKTITSMGTVNNGNFEINSTIPENMKSGTYSLVLYAYEKDLDGIVTNSGYSNYNIHVNQVPKYLEIILNQTEVSPGKSLKIKTILYDQAKEEIQATSIVTIKNGKDTIIQQTEQPTGKYFDFSITDTTEPPAEWIIYAVSNKLSAENTFNISEVKEVQVFLEGNIVLIKNIGNVNYDEPVFIKLGNNSEIINDTIGVGKTKKFKLTGENGQYSLEVSSKGEKKFNESVTLTGQAINGQLLSGLSGMNFNNILFWTFLILIIAGVAFLIIRRNKRKNFGYSASSSKAVAFEKPMEFSAKKDSLITSSRNPAEVQTSMTGEKQFASAVCVKIKNFSEFGYSDKSVKETVEKLVDIAEDSKAYTYDNQDSIIFLFIQSRTKTADNEKIALNVADKAMNKLKEHNRLFKTKLNFGISAVNGEIVCKQNGNGLIFTSGGLIPSAKALAGDADNEIALGEKLKEKTMASIRVERKGSIYILKEIKSAGGTNKTFAEGFVQRYKKEQEKKKEESI